MIARPIGGILAIPRPRLTDAFMMQSIEKPSINMVKWRAGWYH